MERMAAIARSSASVATKTKAHLAPTALQGLEVLALPVASLPSYIEQVAESNPLIEIDFSDGLFSYGELPEAEECDESPMSQGASVLDNVSESAPPLVIVKEIRRRLSNGISPAFRTSARKPKPCRSICICKRRACVCQKKNGVCWIALSKAFQTTVISSAICR